MMRWPETSSVGSKSARNISKIQIHKPCLKRIQTDKSPASAHPLLFSNTDSIATSWNTVQFFFDSFFSSYSFSCHIQ